MQVCLALHSPNQDVVFNSVQEQLSEENLDWDAITRLSIPLWLTDLTPMRAIIEKIAKAEYRRAGENFEVKSRAEKTAFWYILIGKKKILQALYKTEP